MADDDEFASSSDTHALLVGRDDHPSKKVEEVTVVSGEPEDVDETDKFAPESAKDVAPVAESSRGPSISTVADPQSDGGSVRSMPIVRVTESPVPMIQEPSSPAPSPSPSTLSHRLPPSPARSQTLQEPTAHSQPQQRRAGRRSTAEGRAANRLSGFFNNLMNRRDVGNANSRDPIQETAPPSPLPQSQVSTAPAQEAISRPNSPPPPSLPPPTLLELGLSLSTLTSDLSPSHFSTPPTSGAFLSPHYLLLCHSQGLDVLPLVSPPAPQPYALVRRVSFKSVVVMEHRGVLVAIAGRRDGVRVYALEEVKKAIEWRIDVEVKRERDRLRRETLKKSSTIRSIDAIDMRDSSEKSRKASLSTPPPGESDRLRSGFLRKSSYGPINIPPSPPPVPLIPRPPISRPPGRKPRSASIPTQPTDEPTGHPPPYMNTEDLDSQTNLRPQQSAVSLRARARARSTSVTNVLSAVARSSESRSREDEVKADWAESSDDEAINIVAAGASGSQALDERTSASLLANRTSSSGPMQPLVTQAAPPTHTRTRSGTLRRNRPSNLDLTLVTSNPTIPPPEPSPAPTLLTLRQALTHSPTRENVQGSSTPLPEEEDDEEDGEGISLAQALMESRLPELPPPGTTQAQEPILLSASQNNIGRVSSNPIPNGQSTAGQTTDQTTNSRRRRRRWSVLLSSPSPTGDPTPEPPRTAPATERSPHRFSRSHSFRSNHSQPGSISTLDVPAPPSSFVPPSTHSLPGEGVSPTPRSSRFLPRILSNALHGRRPDDRVSTPAHLSDSETPKLASNQTGTHAPPPKLEYVKLPGTKNALMIKAVETAKKSFLAILCGDNGEKVELFAGTYRTALGLSRTFILPDSPRSLELQLQGDDLVEVFLVFSQNVFGLEPATVRVREVRIGRAERRAARRRAREARVGDSTTGQNEAEGPDEDTNVNVNIGVSVSVEGNDGTAGDGLTQPPTPTLIAPEHPSSQPEGSATPTEPPPITSIVQSPELLALASAQMGPYTTFQQLTFAPKFPLASIADEYIIPPTYRTFLQYRSEHERDGESNANTPAETAAAQFSPPGLPIPTPMAPSRWLYRDPKGIIHGPWKSSLMQAWYKDGLLPLDLPVRREEDEEFTLLKDLRLQCVDPTQPFRSPPIRSSPTDSPAEVGGKPLLEPISLLAQPRHFGPPALFFSSRGGHSTAIVDSRGRSVLKGRFIWSNDGDDSDESRAASTLGDIRRLEAFDVEDKSVLVAMRQGGLEAVDLRDALLNPADESRTALPHYNPAINTVNRRPPFVWKIGTPIQSLQAPLSALTHKSKGSGFGHLTSKKPSSSGRGNGKVDGVHDSDLDPEDGVFFVGRRDDELYVCERNAGSFRILKLAPTNVTS